MTMLYGAEEFPEDFEMPDPDDDCLACNGCGMVACDSCEYYVGSGIGIDLFGEQGDCGACAGTGEVWCPRCMGGRGL